MRLLNEKAQHFAWCLTCNGCPINVGYEAINIDNDGSISLTQEIDWLVWGNITVNKTGKDSALVETETVNDSTNKNRLQ